MSIRWEVLGRRAPGTFAPAQLFQGSCLLSCSIWHASGAAARIFCPPVPQALTLHHPNAAPHLQKLWCQYSPWEITQSARVPPDSCNYKDKRGACDNFMQRPSQGEHAREALQTAWLYRCYCEYNHPFGSKTWKPVKCPGTIQLSGLHTELNGLCRRLWQRGASRNFPAVPGSLTKPPFC